MLFTTKCSDHFKPEKDATDFQSSPRRRDCIQFPVAKCRALPFSLNGKEHAIPNQLRIYKLASITYEDRHGRPPSQSCVGRQSHRRNDKEGRYHCQCRIDTEETSRMADITVKAMSRVHTEETTRGPTSF